MQDYSYFMGKDGFTWFVGCVEDRNDPLKIGRVRVRVHGYHSDNKGNIATPDLPWSHVIMPASTAGLGGFGNQHNLCLLYTSPSPRDRTRSRMPSSA